VSAPSLARAPRRSRFTLVLAVLLLLGGLGGALAAWQFGWLPTGPALLPLPSVEVGHLEKRVGEAITVARERVVDGPRSAAAWGRYGEVLHVHGYIDEAKTCYENAERLDAEDARWPYLRATCLERDDVEEARRCFERAVERCDRHHPDNVSPRLRYAEFLLGLGDLDEVKSQLAVVAERAPENLRLRFDQGVLAERQGRWQEALKLLLPLSEQPEVRRQVAAHLAAIYQRLGKPEQARIHGDRVTAGEDPGWEDPFLQETARLNAAKSRIYTTLLAGQESRNPGEIIAAMNKLLEESDRDFLVYQTLGRNLRQVGRLDDSERALRRSLELSPRQTRTLHQLSGVRHDQGEKLRKAGKTAEAKVCFEEAAALAGRAAELAPTDAWPVYQQGRSLAELGRDEEALALLRRAVTMRPEEARMHLRLGEMLARMGKTAEARTHLERAAACADPEDHLPAETLKRFNAGQLGPLP
jgi:tetratricopeptide (TPR) repeat protein